MLFLVRDARKAIAKYVDDGRSKNSEGVLEAINEITMLLLAKSDYRGTTCRLKICVDNNCITLPHFIEKILKVNFCHTPANVWSKYYEFLESGPGTQDACEGSCYRDLIDMGTGYPTMFTLPSEAKQIIAFSTEEDDVDKELYVQGRTLMMNEVRSNGLPGETIKIHRWKDGIEGSILGKYSNGMSAITLSENSFYDITMIRKDVTKGHVTLLAYDPVALAEVDSEEGIWVLSKYLPDETQPGYRRYKVQGHEWVNGEVVTALCKIGYTPSKYDDDVLPIQNLTAYKWMAKSLNHMNKDRFELARAYELQAMAILREQERDSETISNEFDVEMDFGFDGVGRIM